MNSVTVMNSIEHILYIMIIITKTTTIIMRFSINIQV